MGFQKLQKIASAATNTAPVTMRLTKRGAAVIQIKKSFFQEFMPLHWSRADVSIGDGDDEGKLLVEPSEEGLIQVAHLKHGLILNIGCIPSIGTAKSKSWPAEARHLDSSIIVTIPELPPAEDNGDAEEEPDDHDADDDTDSGTDAAPPPAPRGETFAGVTIDLTEGRERVSNRGVTAEVTKRQAKLVYLLARSRPSGATRGTILNALWDGKPPAEAEAVLSQIVGDIAEVLAPLKLAIEPKGVGFKLVDL